MIKVPFEFNVWHRHRGNTKYIPARVHNALQAGHKIRIRYRNGDMSAIVEHIVKCPAVWTHLVDDDDIMAYQIVEKK